MGIPGDITFPDQERANRKMSPLQYLAFLFLPPLILGLIAGISEAGSVAFSSKAAHIGFSLVSYAYNWLALELLSQIASRILRPWHPPLWLVLVIGTLLATQVHAPFTALRDPLFAPYLAEGSHFFETWPWNYSDPDYLTEGGLAFLSRLLVWLPMNFLLVVALKISRLGESRFFSAASAPVLSGGNPPVRETVAPRNPAQDEAGAEPSAGNMALLLDRLPPQIGTSIFMLQAQEHYTEVTTISGKAMIYMRFSDAVSVVETQIDGLRVHRSFWVAKSALKNVEAKGSTMAVILQDSRSVPVSRTYRNDVQRALTPQS